MPPSSHQHSNTPQLHHSFTHPRRPTHLLSAIGYWLLAIGYWLFAERCHLFVDAVSPLRRSPGLVFASGSSSKELHYDGEKDRCEQDSKERDPDHSSKNGCA